MMKPPIMTLSLSSVGTRVDKFTGWLVCTTEAGSFGSVPDVNSDWLSSPS